MTCHFPLYYFVVRCYLLALPVGEDRVGEDKYFKHWEPQCSLQSLSSEEFYEILVVLSISY